MIKSLLDSVVLEAGLQGVQAHTQKFSFAENLAKILEILDKIPKYPNKTLNYLGKIPENLN